MTDEKWKHDMQQKMAGYRKPAPLSWAEIEKAVNAAEAKPTKAKKAALWWPRAAAAAALILIVAGAGFTLFHHDQPAPIAQTVVTAPTAPTAPEQPAPEAPTAEPILFTHRTISAAIASAFEPLVETAAEPSIEPVVETTAEPSAEPTEQKTEETTPVVPPVRKRPLYDTPSQLQKQLSTPNRLTAQAYISNGMAGFSGSSDMSPVMAAADPIGYFNSGQDLSNPSTLNNHSNVIESDVHHHQPLRFGVSLRYQLDQRWSIESGLSYTQLSSDITLRSNYTSHKTLQRLHYVGIPVNLNYQLYVARKFGVYLSAGGMVEKMVSGTRDGESVSIKPLQLSLGCGAGAEYRLTPQLSLYAEPGLTYHFDNHSAVPTLYQDQPLNLNINLGIRFSITH